MHFPSMCAHHWFQAVQQQTLPRKFGIIVDYFIFWIVVQSLSCVQLLAAPRTEACQASLSFTMSQNLLKFMYIESEMLSNHLIFCGPLLLFCVFRNKSISLKILTRQVPLLKKENCPFNPHSQLHCYKSRRKYIRRMG